ncbi:MAG: AAA family ATPase, partial [Pseudomonadota bacterium]
GEGGDVFDLWCGARGLGFSEALREATAFTGSDLSATNVRMAARGRVNRLHSIRPIDFGAPSARYHYRDASGQLLCVVERYDLVDGDKEFRPWDVAARRYRMPNPRPLYGVERLEPGPVVVVEGEKCADALNDAGVQAVSAMGGSNVPVDRVDWSPLDGRDVVIWPDADPPGHGLAERVRGALSGRTASFRTLDVSQWRDGYDAADALRDGLDVKAFLRLQENADPWPDIERFDDIEPCLESRYLVKAVLDQNSMSVVYGSSTAGKSFFVLDLCFHIATGRRWRERRVTQAGVLFLAAEGGNGIRNRVVALRRHHQISGIPFAIRRGGLDLFRGVADIQGVIGRINHLTKEWIEAFGVPCGLVVIDTVSRVLAGGDENSAVDMPLFVRNMDSIREATGANTLLVHHSGKDQAKGARGHSSLRAATDTEIEVIADDVDGRLLRSAHVQKQKEHPGGETWNFDLLQVPIGVDGDGDEVNAAVVQPVEDDAGSDGDALNLRAPARVLALALQELFTRPGISVGEVYATRKGPAGTIRRTVCREYLIKWASPHSGDHTVLGELGTLLREVKDVAGWLRRRLSELKSADCIGVSEAEVWELNNLWEVKKSK